MLRDHWETKEFQNAISITNFVDFFNWKTSLPVSRKLRSENIVKHNRNEVLFCYFTSKVLHFHWKHSDFRTRFLVFRFVDFSNGKTSFSASRESRSENVVNHCDLKYPLLFCQKMTSFPLGNKCDPERDFDFPFP